MRTKKNSKSFKVARYWHKRFSLVLCIYVAYVILGTYQLTIYDDVIDVMAVIMSHFDILSNIKGGNALDPTEWASYWE